METIAVAFIFLVTCTVLGTQGQVISEPDDAIVCEGGSTTFTCVLDKTTSGHDVHWYRVIKGGTTEKDDQLDSSFTTTTSTINNVLTRNLTITNVKNSYTGYYWVGTSKFSVCNASLTVATSPPALTVNITKNTESSSIVVQWDEVDDSLTTTYTVTWTSESDLNNVQVKPLEEQLSYTITGLTLDTVYTIAVIAINRCGQGPEYSTSVSLTTDTTSSSISTITAITNNIAFTSTASSSTSTAIAKSSTITTTASNAVSTAVSTTMTTETTNLKTSSTNPSVVITSTNTATDVMSPVSTMIPFDASTDDENSSSSVYIIVGVIIGVIFVLSLLFIIMICYFMRRKGKNNKKNEYSDLTGNGTLDKNMQMVPNSLSTKGDEKPAKPEAEPSYDTVEVHYMMPNMGSANTNSKQCDVLDKSPSKEKFDSENLQPIEYAVVDKSKKTKKKDDQRKANDPLKDTDDVPHSDVPVVTVPRSDDQTSDGVNQNTNNPTIHYAELERLPKATGIYLAENDSSKQYALVV